MKNVSIVIAFAILALGVPLFAAGDDQAAKKCTGAEKHEINIGSACYRFPSYSEDHFQCQDQVIDNRWKTTCSVEYVFTKEQNQKILFFNALGDLVYKTETTKIEEKDIAFESSQGGVEQTETIAKQKLVKKIEDFKTARVSLECK